MITSSFKKIVFTVSALLLVPLITYAQGCTDPNKLYNPLGCNNGNDTLDSLIVKILDTVLLIGVPILTVMIILTGFDFVMAQGNSDKLTKAKEKLLYTVIGGFVLLGAFVIAESVQGTVTDILSGK